VDDDDDEGRKEKEGKPQQKSFLPGYIAHCIK
jgi:hypothetical protein